jgi:beta-galactosidase
VEEIPAKPHISLVQLNKVSNTYGLVTYDRKTKKDAFYFYKANWNAEPMLYLTDKRFITRDIDTTQIKAYCNFAKVELYVNGKSIGTSIPDDLKRVIWNDVHLQKGKNIILVKANSEGKLLQMLPNGF